MVTGICDHKEDYIGKIACLSDIGGYIEETGFSFKDATLSF